MTKRRIAVGLEYDGSSFFGFQSQRRADTPTVQETVERALSRVADEAVAVSCAGRTDTGVHATGQVIHFETHAERDPRGWVRGCNSLAGPAVTAQWAKEVPEEFHARFSATSRRYLYVWLDQPQSPAVGRGLSTWTHLALDARCMHDAAQALVGEHDFSAFRASGCQSPTPYRCIFEVAVRRHARFVVLDIRANAYLLHMVRNVAGALMEVGCGACPENWIEEVLHSRDRSVGAATAPARGLYLVDVVYPERFELPRLPVGPAFLADGNRRSGAPPPSI